MAGKGPPKDIPPERGGTVRDAVFTVDADWRITSFNRAAEEITGLKGEDVLGRNCHDTFSGHPSLASLCALKDHLVDGRVVSELKLSLTGKNGEQRPSLASAIPIPDAEGRLTGAVITIREIPHASLVSPLILDNIADGVFTVDRDWRITSFNRAAEKITGWKREDAMGKKCGDVFHSSICGDDCAIARSMYTGDPTANRSITIKNKKGIPVPVSISAAPLLDHEGGLIGGVETIRDLSLITSLRRQINRKFTFGEIISKSPAMRRLFTILPEIARSESNVLILGESGTGKELVARATHEASTRASGPFIAVNCGALPETLLESELFGYKAGAFTDARHDRPGRFAAAGKGTIFLDEIGDIPAALQVKLLRVLQERTYEPLGSSLPVKADVRIIAATNRDLAALVKEGGFRDDLFYRLNVVRLTLPPLRERKEDIPVLCEHFIRTFAARLGKDIAGISDEALAILMRHNFPGNIRELENIIEYAFILCHGGLIGPEHLPEPFNDQSGPKNATIRTTAARTLAETERDLILRALERNNWRRLATCRELGISKDTLRRKIKRYQIQEPRP